MFHCRVNWGRQELQASSLMKQIDFPKIDNSTILNSGERCIGILFSHLICLSDIKFEGDIACYQLNYMFISYAHL